MIKIYGIKCDCCGWKDDNVEFKDYRKYLNRKCYRCGTILLTNKEMFQCKILNYVGLLFDKLKYINPFYWFCKNSKKLSITIEWPKRKSV